MMKRTLIPFCILAAILMPLAVRVAAHDVKDPVCRMTVDSDTTRYRHKLGNKTFYFCSKQCQVSFAKSPAKYEKLAAQLEKQDLHEYAVELETSPDPAAGRPVHLAFTIRYAKDKKLVQEFETIHDRLFHLLMVTEDLSWFEHQHPVRGEDGVFRKTWTFPRPGKYILYADFTPADGDNQVKPLPITIGGGPERRYPLTPDRKHVKEVGDYRVELQLRPGSLRMEKPAVLTYIVRDRRGRPLRNMQLFIGAPGHLIAISQDGKEVVHTHAIHGSAQRPREAGAIHVTPSMSTEKGPAFSFKLTTPTGGLYKTWAQFMHNNRVITVPFTFHVQDLWAKKSAPAAGAAQLRCPVMKGPIADVRTAPSLRVNNVPVYFCCAGCDEKLKEEPAKYLKQVKDPVTGKPFTVTPESPRMEHGGGLFLFSSAGTHQAFHARPAKYAHPRK